MNQKPPRRNLPSPAEAWGRWIDNKIQALENKLILSLKNLNAALAANTSSLKSLSYLADTGWSDVPWTTLNGTATRLRWRKVGGMVTIDGQVADTYTASTSAYSVATGIVSPWLPDANMWGSAYFGGGWGGSVYITPSGNINVFQQTGASRSSVQFTIVYPAPRV